jgi:hypothetical protein
MESHRAHQLEYANHRNSDARIIDSCPVEVGEGITIDLESDARFHQIAADQGMLVVLSIMEFVCVMRKELDLI